MDPGFLVEGVLRSVLGGRRKHSGRALRYLTGGGRSLWSNPTTLLTAAGVAWGIFETMTKGAVGAEGAGAPAPADGAVADSSGPPPGGIGRDAAPSSGERAAAPSSAGAGAAPATAAVGSLVETAAHPDSSPLPIAPSSAGPAVDADALRLIRLAVSAANADGATSDREREEVVQQARGVGVADLVEREFQQRRPLVEIVAGVTDPTECATLYVLAFTVVRADEQVSGAERIYLAQLANLLGLSPAMVQQLEMDTGERIDALGDEGPLGG